MKNLERNKLTLGFVPITCATPIIGEHALGYYERYGLDVDIVKGWLGCVAGQMPEPRIRRVAFVVSKAYGDVTGYQFNGATVESGVQRKHQRSVDRLGQQAPR